MIKVEEIIKSIEWDKLATVILALWGAVLSTIIFLKDKPNIKVSLQRGFFFNKTTKDLLILVIVNSGRSPINVISARFFTDDSKDKAVILPLPDQYLDYNLPRTLGENEQINLSIPYDIVKSCAEESGLNINYIGFTDTLGNVYKSKLNWRIWSDLKFNKSKNFVLKVIERIRFF